jgi:hypothetical protein
MWSCRITPSSEANQADGMSVALLNTAVYGTNGAGPVFGEGPNFTSSIGVSFDYYNNGPTPAEPNNNHVSLHWNNAQPGNAVTPSFNMSNSRFHRAQVIVWFSAGNAYVAERNIARVGQSGKNMAHGSDRARNRTGC